MIVWFTYAVKWLSQWVQLIFIFSYRYNKKKRKRKVHFPLMIGTLRTYSLNFSMCHTALLIIVIMLYITYLVLVYLITGIFYLLTNFIPPPGKAHIYLNTVPDLKKKMPKNPTKTVRHTHKQAYPPFPPCHPEPTKPTRKNKGKVLLNRYIYLHFWKMFPYPLSLVATWTFRKAVFPWPDPELWFLFFMFFHIGAFFSVLVKSESRFCCMDAHLCSSYSTGPALGCGVKCACPCCLSPQWASLDIPQWYVFHLSQCGPWPM